MFGFRGLGNLFLDFLRPLFQRKPLILWVQLRVVLGGVCFLSLINLTSERSCENIYVMQYVYFKCVISYVLGGGGSESRVHLSLICRLCDTVSPVL